MKREREREQEREREKEREREGGERERENMYKVDDYVKKRSKINYAHLKENAFLKN